jgi:protein TonB
MREPRTVAVSPSAAQAAPILFQSLVVTRPSARSGRTGATLFASAGLHSLLVSAVVVLPLLLAERLPAKVVDGFIPEPLQITLQPPPPAPPPGGRGGSRPARPAPTMSRDFVALGATATEILVETNDFGLDAVGDRNGVPGAVLDAAVGSVLTDLPPPPAQATARPVHVGGKIAAPRLLRRVAPVYPELAVNSRVPAIIVLEAEVDASGHVRSVSVLRGHPLFDEEAVAAVRQWVYQPLLLNGEPTAFILTVTVGFALR